MPPPYVVIGRHPNRAARTTRVKPGAALSGGCSRRGGQLLATLVVAAQELVEMPPRRGARAAAGEHPEVSAGRRPDAHVRRAGREARLVVHRLARAGGV